MVPGIAPQEASTRLQICQVTHIHKNTNILIHFRQCIFDLHKQPLQQADPLFGFNWLFLKSYVSVFVLRLGLMTFGENSSHIPQESSSLACQSQIMKLCKKQGSLDIYSDHNTESIHFCDI